MIEPKRKTLKDFPKFNVAAVRRGQTDEDGYIAFDLEGQFDRVIERGEVTWFWLLIGERAAICPQWKSFDEISRVAVVVAREKVLPEIAGKTLYYLSPGWDAYNVWMVLDENWEWERVRFQAVDAAAESFETNEISIVDGREVKMWTKLERADKRGHTSRKAPVNDQSSLSGANQQVVPGGCDHEHCELCRAHIDHNNFGYRDRDDRWMCEICYEKYVTPHDLSFVDEL